MKKAHELLDDVKDEATFLTFAKALLKDREPHEGKTLDDVGFSGDWANNSISGYLEAAIAWAEDSNFGDNIKPESNAWKKAALFLYCGKIYE